MTSMRTLNRRLLRWRRYARRTCWNPRVTRPIGWGRDTVIPRGMVAAFHAVEAEWQRRADRARDLNVRAWNDGYAPYPGGECYCGGCIGMGPCDDLAPDGIDDIDDDCVSCGDPACRGDCEDDLDDDEGEWPPGIVTIDTRGLL